MAITHHVLVKWNRKGGVWKAIDEGRRHSTIAHYHSHHTHGIYVYFNTLEDKVDFILKWL